MCVCMCLSVVLGLCVREHMPVYMHMVLSHLLKGKHRGGASGLQADFLGLVPNPLSIKRKIGTSAFSKSENWCSVQASVQRVKRQATVWKNIYASLFSLL